MRGKGVLEDYLNMKIDHEGPIIIHSCCQPWYLVEQVIRRENTFLGFNALLSSPGDEGERMREAAARAPLNSILIESDAPKLSMVTPNGDKIKGEPGCLRDVLEWIYCLRKENMNQAELN